MDSKDRVRCRRRATLARDQRGGRATEARRREDTRLTTQWRPLIMNPRTIRPFLAIALAVAAFVAPSVAHEGHTHEAPRKVPDAELHRPTPMPDRIILTWSGDPATTQAVTWRTDPTIRNALAQIAVATAGPAFAGQSKQYDATTM